MKIPRKIFGTHEKMLNSQPIQSKAMYSENPIKSGCIEVICGSMFSGKTEELIRRLKRAQFANQKIEIFKPAVDKRYSDMDVVSHDLHSIPCTPVKDAAKMLECSDETQVIGIDEAQFFGETSSRWPRHLQTRVKESSWQVLTPTSWASLSVLSQVSWQSPRTSRKSMPSA